MVLSALSLCLAVLDLTSELSIVLHLSENIWKQLSETCVQISSYENRSTHVTVSTPKFLYIALEKNSLGSKNKKKRAY